MSVYVRHAFLTPAECAAACEHLGTPLAPAAVNERSRAVVAGSVRRSRVGFLDPARDPASERLRLRLDALVHSVNDRFYRFDLAGHEPIQFAEYVAGDEYTWHLDIGPGQTAHRKLSVSVQLSPPEDYDGGQLEIWGGSPEDACQGTAVVFPSYLLHRVTPVTRGVRRSIVMWATGLRSFR